GHVDRELAQVVAERVRDPRAERMVDTLRMVDEHAEPVGPVELDSEHLRARDCVLDPQTDLPRQLSLLRVRRYQNRSLSQKMGAARPFQPAEMWCRKCSKRLSRTDRPRPTSRA